MIAHDDAQQTPSGRPLKAIRYEDARDGVPPVKTQASATSRSPFNSPTASPPPSSPAIGPVERSPQQSPSPTAPVLRAFAVADVKRDSAFSAPVSPATRSSSAGGAANEPTLPTIVVQEDESAGAELATQSSGALRSEGLTGIDTSVPSGTLEGIDLGDLASDKVGFSNRGSILFGGRRMTQTPESEGAIAADGKALHTAPTTDESGTSEGQNKAVHQDAPKRLVAGRRKPSVQMLHAALHGGRVLSAEETTFSMKVRSMYEYGDERAAQWAEGHAATTNGVADSRSSPDMNIDEVLVGSKQSSTPQHPAIREPSPDARASYVKKDSELAGGIEDWGDVSGQDVDRYGFISAGSGQSRDGSDSRGGATRVAPSLRLEAGQPRRTRKLHRNPSSAERLSRSVPAKSKKDTTVPGGSIYSFQSTKSAGSHSANPFMSRTRRTVAEASGMLTPPPGLENIRENDDAGKTASNLKRREWAREQKWQRMASPVSKSTSAKGAGMQFTFDTSDAKVISRTWKGIPDRWRATAWHSFLAASARKRGATVTDDELILAFERLQNQSSADDVQIDMDVPRTINLHIMFRRRYRGGQRLLFRVLHAMSLYFPDIGYVQGMASLAATLLCYYDEEHAFVMMVRLWQLRGLEQLYSAGFQGLMDALKEFEDDWLGGGDVGRRLEDLGITSTAYGTRWYLTLFNMSVPFPAQLRVWDVFMLLGDATAVTGSGGFGGAELDVLHATSAALIDATREVVLDSDFENAMKVLTSFVPVRDDDLLMRVVRAEWKMRKKRAGVKVS